MLGTLGAATLLVAGTQVANADTIKIQQGDTVWGYAQKYHISIDDIVKSNKLADANLIIAGRTINIPGVNTSTGVAAITTGNEVGGQKTSNTTSDVPTQSSSSAQVVASAAGSSATNDAAATSSATGTTSTAATSGTSPVTAASASTSSSTSTAATGNKSAATAASTSTSSSTTADTASAGAATNSSTMTGTTSSAATTSTIATASASSSIARGGGVSAALAIANSGIGYVYGGSSLSGFDCSGLVQYVYGLSSSYRTTIQQAKLGTHHYDVSNAPYGALVFWGSESAPYHVGISLGNGTYVAAQNSQKGIGVFSQTYYQPSFYINY